MKEISWLNKQDIVAIHHAIMAESGGNAGILNENALDSTLHKPINLDHYSDHTASRYELAAAYGYGLVKNHCFVDGNKRIALILMYTFLAINGIELVACEIDAAHYIWELAASQDAQTEDVQKLADWLQVNSEVISRR